MLTVAVYLRTAELGFIIGFSLAFYFSLYGAWFVVYNAHGGNVNARYFYLFNKLVAVKLDSVYLESVALYALFVLLLQVVVLLSARPKSRESQPIVPLTVNPRYLPFLSLAAMSGSAFLFKDQISYALAANTSLYKVINTQTTLHYDVSRFYTLHSILNQTAAVGSFFSLIIVFCGRQGRIFVAKRTIFDLSTTVFAAVTVSIYLFMLGSKGELLFVLIASTLFALCNVPRGLKRLVYLLGALLFLFVSSIDAFRSLNVNQLYDSVGDKGFLSESVTSFTTSTEAFAAHFSLYAAIKLDVPLIYGHSLLSLLFSILPRFLWPSRPDTVYEHYVESIDAAAGQGYTIHHATGWYLNFGHIGIIIAAVLVGLLWTWLYNQSLQFNEKKSKPAKVFYALAVFFFVAGLSGLLRSGPEGYKGLCIDSFLIPWLLIFPFVITDRGAVEGADAGHA